MDMDRVADKLGELKQDEAMKECFESVAQPMPLYHAKEKPLAPLSQKIRDKFAFFGLAGIIYAIFFTFCLYKNMSGITAPLFAVGTVCYFFLSLRQLEVTIRKECIFYAGAILLLGINLCLTDDAFLIFCDYVGIFLLLISGLLHLFYEDKEWGLPEYLNAIAQTVFGSLENIPRPFQDAKIWKKQKKGEVKANSKAKYVLLGILMGLPLLIVVLLLLSSADAVFANMFYENFLKKILEASETAEGIGDLIGIFVMTLLVYVGSYGLLVHLGSKAVKVSVADKRTMEPLIAITISAMLGIVYLIFSLIQILYLFMGKFALPEGYTYASYARQGFFQLLLVCIINMVLVLICLYRFKESKALKGMLVLISGCTYIMIASSALRMYMYVEAYDLSYLRVLVFWGLGIIFCVMTGIVVYIFRQKFPLFTYCMVVVTILYLGLAYARPEYLIASYNLNEQHMKGHVDYHYLNRLSADAFPAIEAAVSREDNEEFTGEFEYYLEHSQTGKDSIREYNFSRAYMQKRGTL